MQAGVQGIPPKWRFRDFTETRFERSNFSRSVPRASVLFKPCFYNSTHKRFRAANHPATSANQKVPIHNPREKPEEWLPYFPQKLKHIGRVEVWLILNETFKVSNGTRSLVHSKEANCVRLNAGIRLGLSYVPPVSTGPHCGQIEGWRGNRRGSWLSLESSVVCVVVVTC